MIGLSYTNKLAAGRMFYEFSFSGVVILSPLSALGKCAHLCYTLAYEAVGAACDAAPQVFGNGAPSSHSPKRSSYTYIHHSDASLAWRLPAQAHGWRYALQPDCAGHRPKGGAKEPPAIANAVTSSHHRGPPLC